MMENQYGTSSSKLLKHPLHVVLKQMLSTAASAVWPQGQSCNFCMKMLVSPDDWLGLCPSQVTSCFLTKILLKIPFQNLVIPYHQTLYFQNLLKRILFNTTGCYFGFVLAQNILLVKRSSVSPEGICCDIFVPG